MMISDLQFYFYNFLDPCWSKIIWLLLRRTLVRKQFYSAKSVENNFYKASKKTYFHLRLSIQYVKFLMKGISKIRYNFRASSLQRKVWRLNYGNIIETTHAASARCTK